MWYVIQVRTGTEESIQIQCEKNISGKILKECFIPRYEEQRKYLGEWRICQRTLFPGYLFLVSEHLDELYQSLKHVIGLTKLLGTGREIIPLSQDEIQFLLRFGGEEQLVKLSQGIIEQSRVRVLLGPLQGMEGYIRRIDRHKRKAYLEIPMFGRILNAQVGLEIMEKCE
ncbi:MAG: antiterminator LoaP [Lachnospiraceae bacterium]|nr:antiterminator LoaP [Lachnospiraceae bacterium]